MIFFFYYLFRYFINLFYSLHCLSFHFLRDADSRKGTLCPFCVPIHKKKNQQNFVDAAAQYRSFDPAFFYLSSPIGGASTSYFKSFCPRPRPLPCHLDFLDDNP